MYIYSLRGKQISSFFLDFLIRWIKTFKYIIFYYKIIDLQAIYIYVYFMY